MGREGKESSGFYRAGPSAEEGPAEAHEWTLELADGRALQSPGNFFYSLLEPIIWGTRADFVGLPADLDGDGAIELGEVLPEANVLLAAAQGLDGATGEMINAVEGWQPSLSDAFTALVVMIPTMNEYFEQWKLSAFVAEQAEETAFVGALAVLVVGTITFKLQTRLPYKKMLVWTGVLIGLVLVTMVGKTVHVMQAVGWVGITPIPGVVLPYWAGLWFGLYATWQGVIAQIAAAVFVIGSYYVAEGTQSKRRRAIPVSRAERAGQP